MNIVFAEPIGLSNQVKETFSSEMKALGHIVFYNDDTPSSQVDLSYRIVDADILVVSNFQVSKEAIEKASRLKMIAVAFTGVDHIPLEYVKKRGIVVCNAAGYSTHAVAELTIAMAIDLLRKITPFDANTRVGKTRNGFLGSELRGKTIGILGFGAIGAKVAGLAEAFGCKIISWSRSEKKKVGVDFVSFETLLKNADIVTLHLPLNESTRNLIDKQALSLMKPTAVIINTARGPIINFEALKDALKKGDIAGAAIDVYEHEPPIELNHPLFGAPNTLLLPHIGFATCEAIDERSKIVINNIKHWLNGSPINLV